MAYPEHLLSDGERVVQEFRPHWKAIIKPMLLFDLVLAVGVVVAVVTDVAAWLAIGAALLLGALLVAWPVLNWAFTKYVITNERVIVRSGVLARAGKEIPLEVINDVTFSQTFGERLLRSGDLVLESAGEMGQSHYSDIPHPERIQSAIYGLREDRISALNSAPSAADQLATLAKLHADGVLTDEEFAEKKRKLLGEI